MCGCVGVSRRARLNFDLQRQHLIELIQQGRIEDALAFAQDTLGPHGEESPELLEALEQAMTLLLYEEPAACPVGHLLATTQRQQVADQLNTAILNSLRQSAEPRLPPLLRTLQWAQECLDEHLLYPQVASLSEVSFNDPPVATRPVEEPSVTARSGPRSGPTAGRPRAATLTGGLPPGVAERALL